MDSNYIEKILNVPIIELISHMPYIYGSATTREKQREYHDCEYTKEYYSWHENPDIKIAVNYFKYWPNISSYAYSTDHFISYTLVCFTSNKLVLICYDGGNYGFNPSINVSIYKIIGQMQYNKNNYTQIFSVSDEFDTNVQLNLICRHKNLSKEKISNLLYSIGTKSANNIRIIDTNCDNSL